MKRFALFTALVLCLSATTYGDSFERREKAYRMGAANQLVKMANWCKTKRLYTAGQKYLDEALSLVPNHKGALYLQKKMDGTDTTSSYRQKLLERKKKSYGKKIGKYYLVLYQIKENQIDSMNMPPKRKKHKYKQALKKKEKYASNQRYYLARAYKHYPSKAKQLVYKVYRKMAGRNQWKEAKEFITKVQEHHADSTWEKLIAQADKNIPKQATKPTLMKCGKHPIHYYVSIPKNWNKDKKWPVLVAVEGAGCNFAGAANSFHRNRKDLPYIVVVPLTFSNTNALHQKKYKSYPADLLKKHQGGSTKGSRLKFDSEGLIAITKEVQEKYNGEDKVYITGFSGGGNLTWFMTFVHPEKVAASAPASANFYPAYQIPPGKDAVRAKLPIQALQGRKDPYLKKIRKSPIGLNHQWAWARQRAIQAGYKTLYKRQMVKGGHTWAPNKVVEFFEKVRSGKLPPAPKWPTAGATGDPKKPSGPARPK